VATVLKPCPIRKAIDLLNATRFETVGVSDNKESSYLFDPDVLKLAKGLFSSSKKYNFQLHATNTVTSAVTTGIVAFSFALNPAVTSFSEWTALSALFDECKARSSRFSWVASGNVLPCAMFLGFDQATTTGVAPGYGNVQRLAKSIVFNSNFCVGGSSHQEASSSICAGRVHAVMTTPISTTIDVGMNGQWDMVGQTTVTPSTIVGWTQLTAVVEFRCRA
jgi:hypothetical protein